MGDSRVDILLHVVWATYRRLPLLVPAIEQPVYACLMRSAAHVKCEAIAIGGMPDHVHVVLRLAPDTAVAAVVRRMKGVSSTLVRERLLPGETFAWQDGYAAFSFSRSHLSKVERYVRNQKRHHAEHDLWPAWESADDAPGRANALYGTSDHARAAKRDGPTVVPAGGFIPPDSQ